MERVLIEDQWLNVTAPPRETTKEIYSGTYLSLVNKGFKGKLKKLIPTPMTPTR